MTAIAEFVMRGRFQALLVAVAGSGSLLFCWISAAVVALVTLRKGAGEGAWLLMWAMLPAGVLAISFGDSGPALLLLGATALAMVLRSSVSLTLTILASVAVGSATAVCMLAFGDAMLDQMVAFFGDFLASMEEQLSAGAAEPVQLARPTALQVAGMMGAGNALLSVVCLLLARYWQAAMFNPGGFGHEFRALRYPAGVATALAVTTMALASLGVEFRTWAMICAVPLNFAGIALVHARAAARGQGRGWLTAFYAAWLVFDPVKLFVVGYALADSWMNFRQRWTPSGGGPPADSGGSDPKD